MNRKMDEEIDKLKKADIGFFTYNHNKPIYTIDGDMSADFGIGFVFDGKVITDIRKLNKEQLSTVMMLSEDLANNLKELIQQILMLE